MSADRAKDSPKKPVYMVGAGESVEMSMISQMHDFTSSRAFVTSGREAFKMAGISHSDVDHIMIYDAFAHLPIFGMEDLGFRKKGEAAPWFAEMNSAPGGELPVNTNGGDHEAGREMQHRGYCGIHNVERPHTHHRHHKEHAEDEILHDHAPCRPAEPDQERNPQQVVVE